MSGTQTELQLLLKKAYECDFVATLMPDSKAGKASAALAAEYHKKADELRQTAVPAVVARSTTG